MTSQINSLKSVLSKLKLCKHPEDFFGEVTDVDLVKGLYRKAAKLVHPDKNQKQLEIATEATKLLTNLWKIAQKKLEAGIYGDRTREVTADPTGSITFSTRKFFYVIGDLLTIGGTRKTFSGTVTSKSSSTPTQIIIKIPHTSLDNDLMDREAEVLKNITKIATYKKDRDAVCQLLTRIPLLIDTVKIKTERGIRHCNIFSPTTGYPNLSNTVDGWYTLQQINDRYKEGVDTRVAVFIWNRVLEALTVAHLCGVTHGSVTPNHILIHAESHAGLLLDWTTACNKDDKLLYRDEKYKAYFPPEAISTPSGDLFSLAWCIVKLLGGCPEDKQLRKSIQEPIVDFLNRCLQPKIKHRPKNAEVAYRELEEICLKVFGPKKFVELKMP